MFAREPVKTDPEKFHNMVKHVLKLYEECMHVYSIRECAYSTEIEKASFSVSDEHYLYFIKCI